MSAFVDRNQGSSDASHTGAGEAASNEWLNEFHATHGRSPRVLHIGNIANNAYLNAKILNAAGFDCDVICYDYYHIMGCPEWEDATFDGDIADHFHPDWNAIDLHGFERPRWFAQGPRELCIEYLIARRQGESEKAEALWRAMRQGAIAARLPTPVRGRLLRRTREYMSWARFSVARRWRDLILQARGIQDVVRLHRYYLISFPGLRLFTERVVHTTLFALGVFVVTLADLLMLPRTRRRLEQIVHRGPAQAPTPPQSPRSPAAMRAAAVSPLALLELARRMWRRYQGFLRSWDARLMRRKVIMDRRASRASRHADAPDHHEDELDSAPIEPSQPSFDHSLIERFASAFPARHDQLTEVDLLGYAGQLSAWSRLFDHYDVVVGYATDGVLPLLCAHRPYFAYEHGTIRNIPFQATTQGRLCAATYRFAERAMITNCDNIHAAAKLELDNYRFIPHPVNESYNREADVAALRESVCRELDCDFLVFHPARQHWDEQRHPDWEKGNDILIRGFAKFVHEHCSRAGAVFVDWGQTVDASKSLLEELGIADRVKWIGPVPNRRMVTHIRAVDAVADQFFLGAFGSLTPKAMLHECPVLLCLDEERHGWCFPELPPILNVRTPDEVCEALVRLARDAAFRASIRVRGRAWYERYHSSHVIQQTFARAIGESLSSTIGPERRGSMAPVVETRTVNLNAQQDRASMPGHSPRSSTISTLPQ